MAGSILIDTKKEAIKNTFDGKIFQKIRGTWVKFEHTMFRSIEAPEEAEEGDVWLSNEDNNLYLYDGINWNVTNRTLYFTEVPLTSDDGNNNDYNVLSGIIQVAPIVKFGSAEETPDTAIPYAYINKTDRRLHVVCEMGDYIVNYANEEPARVNSLANALINDTTIYPELSLRKTINH